MELPTGTKEPGSPSIKNQLPPALILSHPNLHFFPTNNQRRVDRSYRQLLSLLQCPFISPPTQLSSHFPDFCKRGSLIRADKFTDKVGKRIKCCIIFGI